MSRLHSSSIRNAQSLHNALTHNPAVHACTTFVAHNNRAVAIVHTTPGKVFGTSALPAQGNRVNTLWDHAWRHAGYSHALNTFSQYALTGLPDDKILTYPDTLSKADRIMPMQSDSTHLTAQQVRASAAHATKVMGNPFIAYFDTQHGAGHEAMLETLRSFFYTANDIPSIPSWVVFAIAGSAAHYAGLVQIPPRLWMWVNDDTVMTQAPRPFAVHWQDRATAFIKHAPKLPSHWHARGAQHQAREDLYQRARTLGFAITDTPAKAGAAALSLPLLNIMRRQLDEAFTTMKFSELLTLGERIETGWAKRTLMASIYRPLQMIDFGRAHDGSPLSAIETCREACRLHTGRREQAYYRIVAQDGHYIIQDRLSTTTQISRSEVGLAPLREEFVATALPRSSSIHGIPIGSVERDGTTWNETLLVLDNTPLPSTEVLRRSLLRLMAEKSPHTLHHALFSEAILDTPAHITALNQALLERGIITPHALARSGSMGPAPLFIPDRRENVVQVLHHTSDYIPVNGQVVHREPLFDGTSPLNITLTTYSVET